MGGGRGVERKSGSSMACVGLPGGIETIAGCITIADGTGKSLFITLGMTEEMTYLKVMSFAPQYRVLPD